MASYIENMDHACKARGLTLTQVLREIGKARSNVTSWKNGSTPGIDSCDLMAKYLGISIDELVNGKDFDESARTDEVIYRDELKKDEEEWLSLYHQLPEGKRYAVKTFVMQMVPERAASIGSAKEGVAGSTAS